MVKLLDFGVARWNETESDLTMGRIVGTPAYLAPEQARGEKNIDGRADIWALGVLMYESLAGKRPFKGDSSLVTMMQVVMDQPVPLDRRVPTISKELAQVVHRCLSKSPGERFPSADSLKQALSVVDTSGTAPKLKRSKDLEDAEETISVQTASMRGGTGILTMVPDDEQRVVAIVLANGVKDPGIIKNNVEQRGGIFVPLLGRQAIGLFGGTEWEGDEVVRAASAALLSRGAAKWMSVASGRGMRRGQSISGAVLDAAERCANQHLEGIAAPKDTIQALGGGFSVREVKDNLYELTAERAPYWPVGTQDDARDPPIFGRDAQVTQMEQLLDETVSGGTANSLLVLGPAGIGKTRLRRELENLIEKRSEYVKLVMAQADSRKRERSFSLFAEALSSRARLGTMLRGWPDISPEASQDERYGGILALVRNAIGDEVRAHEAADFLGELLGVPVPDSTRLIAARRDPQLMVDRIQIALRDYFEGAAEQGAVALVIENLQWADDASIQLLQDLLDQLAFSPFFLFATGRPEVEDSHPGLFADRGGQRIQLHGLRPADVGKLATSIVGEKVPSEVLKAIARRTEGNPLFVTEIVRVLQEEGSLGAEIEDLPLPLNVEGAVQSRLDQLPSREKELCKRAAVYGRPVTPSEMRALGIEEAEQLFSALARRELVSSRTRMRAAAEREYAFRTDLVADVAYRMLKDTVAQELHRRAANFLIGRPEPDPEEVAEHYEKGGQLVDAADRYTEAALGAERRGDSLTVLKCAERALKLGAPADKLFQLHMARADALRFRGRREEQAIVLSTAIELARTDEERARALMEQAVCMSRTGRISDALGAAKGAVHAARVSDNRELMALTRGRQANLLTFSGQLTEAGDALRETVELAEGAETHIRALVAEWRGLHANASGDLGAQVAAFREAAGLYTEAGDVRRAAGAENNVADAYNRVGAYADAEDALRATVDKCRRVGNRLIEGYALVNLGYSLGRQGKFDAAFSALDQASALAESNSDVRLSLFVQVYRAGALLSAAAAEEGLDRDKLREAVSLAEDAGHEADRLSLPGTRIIALTAASRALLTLGDRSRALALCSEAMNLRDQLGGTEEDEAELFLVHAAAQEASGLRTEAAATRRRGRERLELIASRIVDPDLRARYLNDVDAHRELESFRR